jgi:hypothetical protein
MRPTCTTRRANRHEGQGRAKKPLTAGTTTSIFDTTVVQRAIICCALCLEPSGYPGDLSEPPRISGRVLGTPSVGRLKAGLKTHPNAVGKAGLLPLFGNGEFGTRSAECRARITSFFSGTMGHGTKLGRTGQTGKFSIYGGTAGQSMLNIIDTTIQCPTKLSHFRDRWDTAGGNATVRERASMWRMGSVVNIYNAEARSLTVAFPPVLFLGHWDMGQNRDRRMYL